MLLTEKRNDWMRDRRKQVFAFVRDRRMGRWHFVFDLIISTACQQSSKFLVDQNIEEKEDRNGGTSHMT